MAAAPPGAKVRARRWLARAADGLGAGTHDAAVRCLTYHSIVEHDRREPEQMTTSVAQLRSQLKQLAAGGYQVRPASAVVAQLQRGVAIEAKTVILTFDDGFADNYRLAFPVLREFNAPATFFVITAALSGERDKLHNPWIADYLDWEQARQLQASGLIEFGCHTATHRTLRGLPASVLMEETDGAKRTLEDRLESAVTLFAYPFGSYGSWDAAAIEAVGRAGFAGAFTTVSGPITTPTDLLSLKRCRVSWTDEGDEFDRLLRGAYDWYELVQRLQGWRAGHAQVGAR